MRTTDQPRPSPARWLCCLLPSALGLLGLCGCGIEPAPRDSGREVVAVPDKSPVRALPTGTLLRLGGCEIVEGQSNDRLVINGLLREALRQTPAFDIAAGIESVEAPMNLVPALDADAGVLTIALVERRTEDGSILSSLPMASASLHGRSLADAVDEVAIQTRIALGETIEAPPVPCSAIYSSLERCVRFTEQALDSEVSGATGSAMQYLRHARLADPGCTVTMAAFATAFIDRGEPTETVKLSNQALTLLTNRLSATTTHKLARLLLLARGKLSEPTASSEADRQLLALGEAALRERPYDPHGAYTKALALNFLGRFEEALPLFHQLRYRWPQVPWVAYHQCFAELATGHAEAALESIEYAARLLPPSRTVLPETLALYDSGRHEELDRFLDRLAKRRMPRSADDTLHQIYRIQASHAILTGRRDDAARSLLIDLEWMRQRPSQLPGLSMDLAEEGEVLIRIGHAQALTVRLQALGELPVTEPTYRQVLTFLGGLCMIHDSGRSPDVALSTLAGQDQTTWVTVLRAALHHQRGELLDEARELATAIRITDSPLVRASFASALATMGKRDDADRLLLDMRQKLLRIQLRRPLAHPLLSPGNALAFLATESLPSESGR